MLNFLHATKAASRAFDYVLLQSSSTWWYAPGVEAWVQQRRLVTHMETDGRFCDEVEPLCSSAEFRQLCPGIAAGTEHPTKVAHEGFFLPSNLMGAFVEYLESACAYGNHSAPRGSLCLFDALASIQGFAVEEFFLSTYLQLHPSSRAGVRGRGWVCGPSIWAEHQRDLLGHLWPWLLQYCKSQSRILLVPWPKMSMSPYGGAPPARRPGPAHPPEAWRPVCS